MHDYIKLRHEVFESQKLQTVVQLPDILDAKFVLRWIGHEQVEHSPYLAIKYRGRVIHREPIYFEDGKRYGEICSILKQKYGDSLEDALPDPTGWLYLGGDRSSSLSAAKDSRLELFGRTTVPEDFGIPE